MIQEWIAAARTTRVALLRPDVVHGLCRALEVAVRFVDPDAPGIGVAEVAAVQRVYHDGIISAAAKGARRVANQRPTIRPRTAGP